MTLSTTDIGAPTRRSGREELRPDTFDLHGLGQRACAIRRAHIGDRASFGRSRQLLPTGAWRGPRDAAESWVDERDLPGLGGLAAAREAGAWLLVGGDALATHAEAAAMGLRTIWRVPFRAGEDDADRVARLEAAARLDPLPWAVLPTPNGEPQGLDTLRFVASCRVALPPAVHVVSDFAALGLRLAQMSLGFGADALWGPIVGERALRLGANAGNPAMTRREAAGLVRAAGLVPCERVHGGGIEEVAEP